MNTDGAPASIRWQNLPISISGISPSAITVIEPGSRVAVTGPSGTGKSRLLSILAGLHAPVDGFAEIAGFDCRDASRVADGQLLSLARQPEIFHGSVLENVRLGRSWLSSADIRRALERVGLWEDVLKLPGGIDSSLQTGGFPLTYAQTVRLTLARAVASVPSILLIDGILDLLDAGERMKLWNELRASQDISTIVIATHDHRICENCDRVMICDRGQHVAALESRIHG